MTHENQREKEKQMENGRRDYACDPIVTEPGNGRSCFVAEYCSNAVCDIAWTDSAAVTHHRILSVLFWQKEKGKEKDRMLCQAYAWCNSFPCMCDCMRGWFLYACKGRKYAR